MLTFDPHECLGIVLAGGLSSRMGEDKAKLKRNNEDMLSYSKQLLTNIGIKQITVSGNHLTSEKNQIADIVKNAGPVGGIYSILSQLKSKQNTPSAILVLPVDLPLMTADALSKLKLIGELSQKACFFEDHNLPLYLPVNSFVELFLEKSFTKFSGKGPSIKALIKQIPHQAISIKKASPKNPQILFNTNTPEQWQQAKLAFSHSSNRLRSSNV